MIEAQKRGTVVAVVLAGGLARRMGGGDKCLLPLAGRPLLAHILERLKPQVSALALNANGAVERFAGFGLPVLPDIVAGFPGPLAGVLTGLTWARKAHPQAHWLVSVPGDGPLLPHDLVVRFVEASEAGAELVCAASGGRNHPVIGFWPLSLTEALRQAVVEEEIRKVDRWTARYRLSAVTWPTTPHDPFFNVNSPEDLHTAEGLLKISR
ncbi:MAG: molybdenum cofactor guanylyltransferase MobA [Rhodospirillales bacterium]|nr:molybdenum cofactor guanylyltransferase MobA [Rhodospirillales bacterium]